MSLLYTTLDNGGYVYNVGIHEEVQVATICATGYDHDPLHVLYKDCFIGTGSFHGEDEDFRGNALLLEVDLHRTLNNFRSTATEQAAKGATETIAVYMLVADRIQLFASPRIVGFASLVGNAGVPSPMAWTSQDFLDMSAPDEIRAYPLELLRGVDMSNRRALYSFAADMDYRQSRELLAPVANQGFDDPLTPSKVYDVLGTFQEAKN
jgi:hypothetical protein